MKHVSKPGGNATRKGRDHIKSFYYQPSWIDFSIFWSGAVALVGSSVILQMEFGAYDSVFWPAVLLLAATLGGCVIQIFSRKLTLSPQVMTLARFTRRHTLTIPLGSIRTITAKTHSLCLDTTTYGKITIVRLVNLQKLCSAFADAGLIVVHRKGNHRV